MVSNFSKLFMSVIKILSQGPVRGPLDALAQALIKRTLMCKLADDGQNVIYCVRFKENFPKLFKNVDSWKCANITSFSELFLYMANSGVFI